MTGHGETHQLSFVSVSQRNVERRLFFFRFGDPRARMNWVHVDNLILAHRLAAEALTQQRDYISVSEVIRNMTELGDLLFMS